MKFKILSKSEYSFPAHRTKGLLSLIKAKKVFTLVESRNNFNYLLECEGIRQWFAAHEIKEVRDPDKPVFKDYYIIEDYPNHVITRDGKMGKLVPDFIPLGTRVSGGGTLKRVVITIYTEIGVRYVKTVAELVLATFTKQPRNRRTIIYKDGDITNLKLENLAYHK